jgi:type I restriction enzyme M protein
VGFEEKDDDEEFEEKMERLTAELSEQFRKSEELEKKIKENLSRLGYEI